MRGNKSSDLFMLEFLEGFRRGHAWCLHYPHIYVFSTLIEVSEEKASSSSSKFLEFVSLLVYISCGSYLNSFIFSRCNQSLWEEKIPFKSDKTHGSICITYFKMPLC